MEDPQDSVTITKNASDESATDVMLDSYNHKLVFKIYLELYTVVSLICITGNILISFVIIKYRRLRQDKSNIILLHWTVVNTLFMIISPLTFRLAVDLSWIDWSNVAYCFVEHLEVTLLLANMLLIILLTLYWFLKLYYPVKFDKFISRLTFLFAGVYIIVVFFSGMQLDSCLNHRLNGLSEMMLMFAYLLFFVYMVVINLVHLCKRRYLQNVSNKKNIPLLLTNAYFASFFPTLFFGLFSAVVDNASIFMIVFCTCMLLSVLSPVYFFFILYRYNKDYETFFRHVLSCRCRDYSGDEMVEQPVVYNNHAQVEENRC